MNTLGYGIKQGFRGMWQNRLFSVAAVGTIAACLFLMGIFFALTSNFRHIVREAEKNVGLTVFFEEGISQKQIDKIGEKIKSYRQVESITYISAVQAWKNFQKEMYGEKKELSETFGEDNPLKDSASYEVYLKDISAQKKLIASFRQIEGVRKVNSSDTVAESMGRFNLLLSYVSVTMILLLLFVSVFLISTAVATGIRVRQPEISIMKYIGATDIFVRLPFVFEGVMTGILGAALPLVLFGLLYGKVIRFILSRFSALSEWLTFLSVGEEMRVLIPLFVVVGVGIGFLGSSLSVRKHLRTIR